MYADVDFSGTFSWQILRKMLAIHFNFKMTGPFMKLFSAQGYRMQKSGAPPAEIYYPKKQDQCS